MSDVGVARFAVDESPRCVWSADLQERNRGFLESFDPHFFEWVADVLVPHLDGDYSHRAALALRVYYGHALETLFAILGAVIQSPDCIYGWLNRYRTGQLSRLVQKVNDGIPVYSRLLIQPITWQTMSVAVHAGLALEDKKAVEDYKNAFGRLWTRFARDYLDDCQQAEYNSLKHGLRVIPGGFAMQIGESQRGDSKPQQDVMKTIGASRFGSTYHVLEALPTNKINYTSKLHSRNWIPMNFVRGLALISISLCNIIAWAEFLNGKEPSELVVRYPTSITDFKGPWLESPGVIHTSLDRTVRAESIDPMSPEEILAVYEADEEGPDE